MSCVGRVEKTITHWIYQPTGRLSTFYAGCFEKPFAAQENPWLEYLLLILEKDFPCGQVGQGVGGYSTKRIINPVGQIVRFLTLLSKMLSMTRNLIKT